ncbi:MAG: hypothetical protein KC800_31395, partial [Candidatus Eremiobacteraeota bacterium]|nr:hypothetical protein [Candidatus Eremiobacteraeota bacterium]
FWRVRAACVLLIVSFHFGIMLGINIPIFALIGMVGPIGLLPGEFWNGKWPGRFETRFSSLFSGWKRRLPGASQPQSNPRLERAYHWLTYPAMGLMLFGLYRGVYFPDSANYLVGMTRVFSLDQRWAMFSPRPPQYSDWDTAPATLKSGRRIDLLTGRAYEPGASVTRDYQKFGRIRWFNLHMLLTDERRGHTQLYLQYLVERWNKDHPDDPVLTARYEYHYQSIKPNYLLDETRTRVFGTYP